MEKTKFTRGPWRKSKRSNEVLCGTRHICVAALGEPGGFVPAELEAQIATMHANAHLIAAAPDLYAVAERLERYINITDNDDIDAEGELQLLEDILLPALEALAKARGEKE